MGIGRALELVMATHMLAINMRLAFGSHVRASVRAGRCRVTTAQVLLYIVVTQIGLAA